MYNYVEFPGLSNPAGRFDLPQHAGRVHLPGWPLAGPAPVRYLTGCGAARLPDWLAQHHYLAGCGTSRLPGRLDNPGRNIIIIIDLFRTQK